MKNKNFFYQTGVDISSMKSMFNFINGHFTYFTMNSWNGTRSIANNVKVYKLDLTGDEWTALKFLETEEYETINELIHDFEGDHPGYEVAFNGRSGGYMVLYVENYPGRSAIPDEFYGYDTYEEWKADVKDYGYRVEDFFRRLRDFTKVVQDFDRLCDDCRAYAEELSHRKYLYETVERVTILFEDDYYDELTNEEKAINLFDNEDGSVDVALDALKSKALLRLYTDELKSTIDGQIDISEKERDGKTVLHIEEV